VIEVEERFPSTEGLVSDAEGLAAAQALIEEAHQHKRIRRLRIVVVAVVVAVVGSLVVVSQVSSGWHLPLGGQPPKTAPAPVFVESGSPWGPPQQITSGAGAVWVTMSAPTKPGQPPAPSARGGIVRIGFGDRPAVTSWASVAAPQASTVINGSIWTAGFDTGFITQIDVHTGRVQQEIALGPPPSFPGSFTYPDGQFLPSAVAAVKGGLWVVSARGYAVTIDPRTGDRNGQFPLTSAADNSVVADHEGAWVAEGPLGVAHLTGQSNVAVTAIRTDEKTGDVERLLESQGSLWAAGMLMDSSFGGGSPTDGFVARLDLTTGKVLAVARVDAGALNLAATDQGIWATNGTGYLYRVTPVSNDRLAMRATRHLGYPSSVQSLTGTRKYLWSVPSTGRTITRLDPTSGAKINFSL
jgi:hypothetical protein